MNSENKEYTKKMNILLKVRKNLKEISTKIIKIKEGYAATDNTGKSVNGCSYYSILIEVAT